MIAKCQKSIETTEPNGTQLLIYSRTREWIWSGDITPEWNDAFGPDEFRFFAEVQWQDGRTPPLLVRRLPEQHWDNRPGEIRESKGNRGDTAVILSLGDSNVHG